MQGFNKLETEFLTEEIFEDSCYIMPERIHIKEGDTVIDVGGNIGIFGLQAALAVGSTGRVISVEALPPTFELLKANQESAIHQGHVKARWTAINAAAGSSDGHMDMTFFPRAAGWGTSDPMQHRKRMRADLRVFIKSLLQDSTSKVFPSHAPRRLALTSCRHNGCIRSEPRSCLLSTTSPMNMCRYLKLCKPRLGGGC